MRVLLSLMKLDIGGAETHVVELAKELKRRGHDVFVTSKIVPSPFFGKNLRKLQFE